MIVDESIQAYAAEHSSGPPELLKELEAFTHAHMTSPGMLTGPVEGRLLKLLVQLSGAKRVIEVGTFTGNGSLSMAEGLPEDGRVIACEINPKTAKEAQKFFDRSPHGKKIELRVGPALETLQSLKPSFDFIFVDADKTRYGEYYEEALRLLRSGGILAIDNMLWSGKVLNPQDDETRAIHALNEKIPGDPRVEAVLLTVRDGIQLVRKK